MSKAAIIVLGHSHVGALREGLSGMKRPALQEPSATLFIHDVWAQRTDYANFTEAGRLVFNDHVIDAIRRTVPQHLRPNYVSMLGGNGHIIFALQRHPRPFDFVLPERPDLPLEDHEHLPSEYVERLLVPHMMPYIWQLIAFRQAVGVPIYQLETPPPYGDDEYVRQHLGSYVSDVSRLVSAWQRYKFWRLHSALVQRFCVQNDITFVPVPAAAQDAEGFMVREGYGPDATHANAWYGQRVIEQLSVLVGSEINDFHIFTESQ